MTSSKIIPIAPSSKFAICGLPIRADSYRYCDFGCIYCFSNSQVIRGFSNKLKVANVEWLKRKLERVYDKNEYDKTNFLDVLLRDRITWHWGGLSDPYQRLEKEMGVTDKCLAIANQYDVSGLVSTKTDDVYRWENLTPDLHCFQLSVTNTTDRTDIEPNVPPISKRKLFYKDLKDKGFKVGIRIQPFIPGISDTTIVEMFADADYFTIESLKMVPQNEEHKKIVLRLTQTNENDYIQMGLLNLRPELRVRNYKLIIERLEQLGMPYSVVDNDMHYISSSKCCCGSPLVKRSTEFNNTAMYYKKGHEYSLGDVESELQDYSDCVVNHLFTSNRQEGCKTVLDFYKKRFNREASPFSKKFSYIPKSLKKKNKITFSDLSSIFKDSEQQKLF